MKGTKDIYGHRKLPIVSGRKPIKGKVASSHKEPMKKVMQKDMKHLEMQGLEAIQMLKEMTHVLDQKIPYAPNDNQTLEELKKLKKPKVVSKSIQEIQEKNKQIRSVLDGNRQEGDIGYNQLLELEAIFGSKDKEENIMESLGKLL